MKTLPIIAIITASAGRSHCSATRRVMWLPSQMPGSEPISSCANRP